MVDAAVGQAASRLHHGILVGAVARGRAGLGTFHGPCFNKVRDKEWRQIQSELRVAVEEEWSSIAVGMAQQGAWTRWEQTVERLCSLTFGRQSHTASSFWFRQSMMSFPPHPTCTPGVWLIHLGVPCNNRGLVNMS